VEGVFSSVIFTQKPVNHNRIYYPTVSAQAFRVVSEVLWHKHIYPCSLLGMVVKQDTFWLPSYRCPSLTSSSHSEMV